jgi:hypothetical protein
MSLRSPEALANAPKVALCDARSLQRIEMRRYLQRDITP